MSVLPPSTRPLLYPPVSCGSVDGDGLPSCLNRPPFVVHRLLKYLGENAITRMLFTPSLLQLVLDQCSPEDLREGMKTMRIVWLCGEVVTVELR